jgi:enhancing lycopene biosynthesis protein 2
MKKFAIILSGCGQHDGSETHETILTLLAMDKASVNWQGYAPDVVNNNIINHLTTQPSPEKTRSVLEEAARLVRGNIKPLAEINVVDYDAIVFPGGMGAVTVLCDWAQKKADFSFIPDVARLIESAKNLNKPMGFICIAPMMITKIFTDAIFTIGNDKDLAKEISQFGCKHIDCKSTDIVIDSKHKVVSTPANMLNSRISEVAQGIDKLIQELINIC